MSNSIPCFPGILLDLAQSYTKGSAPGTSTTWPSCGRTWGPWALPWPMPVWDPSFSLAKWVGSSFPFCFQNFTKFRTVGLASKHIEVGKPSKPCWTAGRTPRPKRKTAAWRWDMGYCLNLLNVFGGFSSVHQLEFVGSLKGNIFLYFSVDHWDLMRFAGFIPKLHLSRLASSMTLLEVASFQMGYIPFLNHYDISQFTSFMSAYSNAPGKTIPTHRWLDYTWIVLAIHSIYPGMAMFKCLAIWPRTVWGMDAFFFACCLGNLENIKNWHLGGKMTTWWLKWYPIWSHSRHSHMGCQNDSKREPVETTIKYHSRKCSVWLCGTSDKKSFLGVTQVLPEWTSWQLC